MKAHEPIIKISENIGGLIRQGLVKKAQAELELYSAATEKPWRRLYRHYQAKIKLVTGEYESACQEFNEIIADEGPHILLYADLVAGYFMAKQYAKWKLAIDDLNREYELCKKQLQPINKWRTQIILAKSLELNGAIWESYQVFQSLSKSSDINFRIKGLTNLVRLESQYPLTESFSKNYLLLKSFSLKNDQAEYNYDVLHSLLLSEAEHINVASALRTLAIIPREQTCYFALAYFELLDIWMRKDVEAYNKLLSTMGEQEAFTLADEKLLQLAKKQNCTDWYTWPNEIPIAQYFRLIRFLFDILNADNQAICLSQATLIINGLSTQSRKIWMDFLARDLKISTKKEFLQIQWQDSNTIKVADISINLGRQKLIIKLLKLISESSNTITFKYVAEKLWGSNLDDYNYDRIRQLVKRINLITKKNANRAILSMLDDQIKLQNVHWSH